MTKKQLLKALDWREGQYLMNFLQWIASAKVCITIDDRYADIFYLTDETLKEWDKEYQQTLLPNENKKHN